MKLDAGTCRFCGQAIFWAVLPSGKKAPLDPALLYVVPSQDDDEGAQDDEQGEATSEVQFATLIHANTGQTVRGQSAPGPGPGAEPGRANHWSTCPQWRQAKAAKLAKQPPWRELVRSMRAAPCPVCEARGEHEARCTPWGPHWGEVRCFSCKRHLRWLPKPPEADQGAWALYRRTAEEHQLTASAKAHPKTQDVLAGGPT
jgi:hypothetical protein